ncbi:MAG TPA: hypothetical protein VN554_00645, partial [Verrucomicrobiae bacterium]|nr:hypothetical protein [Verrucomicrobiae bacterium]
MREGSPIIPDSAAEGEEARRRKQEAEEEARQSKAKPERFGILAIESDEPAKPSPLEAALARSRRTLESDDLPPKPSTEAAPEEPPAAEAPPLELPAPPPVELLEAADDEPPATLEAESVAREPVESEPVVEPVSTPPAAVERPVEVETPKPPTEAAPEESPESGVEHVAAEEPTLPEVPEAPASPDREEELRIHHARTEESVPAEETAPIVEMPPAETVREAEPPARAEEGVDTQPIIA